MSAFEDRVAAGIRRFLGDFPADTVVMEAFTISYPGKPKVLVVLKLRLLVEGVPTKTTSCLFVTKDEP